MLSSGHFQSWRGVKVMKTNGVRYTNLRSGPGRRQFVVLLSPECAAPKPLLRPISAATLGPACSAQSPRLTAKARHRLPAVVFPLHVGFIRLSSTVPPVKSKQHQLVDVVVLNFRHGCDHLGFRTGGCRAGMELFKLKGSVIRHPASLEFVGGRTSWVLDVRPAVWLVSWQ